MNIIANVDFKRSYMNLSRLLRGRFVFTCLFLLLFGCQSYPSPIIKDGEYINPEYKYSFKIPDGWKASNKIPDIYTTDRGLDPDQVGQDVQLYLSNEKKEAEIMIAGKTSWLSYDTVVNREVLQGMCAFTVNFYKDHWSQRGGKIESIFCLPILDGIELYASLIVNGVLPLRHRAMRILYPKDKDDIYLLDIGVVAHEEKFDDALADYNQIIQSIRARNVGPIDIKN